MATAFTHGFVGALLVPFTPAQVPRFAVIGVLITLAILPDIDVLAFRLGIPYSHPFGHRGFTHCLLFSAGAAVFSACLFYRYAKLLSRAGCTLTVMFFLAAASHGVLDALTDAGLGVAFFWPLDNTRYFFPWRPLATSPIGIESFFTGNVRHILTNEFIWVWIPTVAASALVHAFRSNRKKRQGS